MAMRLIAVSEPPARPSAAAPVPTPGAVGVTGAVVIGGDYQGLGIVRSLGRRGVPVLVLDNEHSVARYSRYAKGAIHVAELRDEAATVAALVELGRRRGLSGWVLFPTRDETVAALSRHRAELAPWFRVATPEWDAVQWIWDKRNTYARARELDIAAPATWLVRSEDELDAVTVDPPYVVKPAIKEHFFYATRVKAWRANSRQELHHAFRRASAQVGAEEVMIQELIPGDGRQQFAYCAMFKDGRALASMTVCRRRQHPPEFGRASTYVETVEAPHLEEVSERFLRAIGYYGLVEMEYKLDPRDGRYKLLDVNGRTWGYHSLGAAAGVDFPYLLFADQLGLPTTQGRARAGVRWVRLATDLPVGLLDAWAGRQRWSAYWRSLRRANTEAVFSRRDPWPGLVEIFLLPYLFAKRGF
jgi:D-aspartate ligase